MKPLTLLLVVALACAACAESPHPLGPTAADALLASLGLGRCVPGEVIPLADVEGEIEGIAVTRSGAVYVSTTFGGSIIRVSPDGSVSVAAQLFDALPAGVPGVVGLAVDRFDNVYAAVVHPDAEVHGVWRVRPDGSAARFASLPAGPFPQTGPNALAFDKTGNLYVSDSFLGAVWKIPPGGGVAELWLQHDLLLENPFGFPFGINGITYGQGPPALYGAITLAGRIIRIPFGPQGAPGTPEIYAESELLFGADGHTMDVHGNIYVANVFFHTIVRVNRDRSVEIAVDDPGLFKPASLVFGNPAGDRSSLFVTNFEGAFQPIPGDPRQVADVVKVDMCTPGQPLP